MPIAGIIDKLGTEYALYIPQDSTNEVGAIETTYTKLVSNTKAYITEMSGQRQLIGEKYVSTNLYTMLTHYKDGWRDDQNAPKVGYIVGQKDNSNDKMLYFRIIEADNQPAGLRKLTAEFTLQRDDVLQKLIYGGSD